MKRSYLEVTVHSGHPMAAYLYLPRQQGEKSYKTSKFDHGMLVDFNQNDKPIGIEITDPRVITAKDINNALKQLGLSEIKGEELIPQ